MTRVHLDRRGQFSLARSGEAVQGVTCLFRLIAVPVLASLGGAVLISLADRETPMPSDDPAATDTTRRDRALT